eukprot:9771733-Alexandrium_andersonii.AAC.1
MASWLGCPPAAPRPARRPATGTRTSAMGEGSTYTFKVPGDDAASQASSQVGKASSTTDWVKVQQPPKKQAKTTDYKTPAERGVKDPRPA